MKRKIYYLFLGIFIFISGVWYSFNLDEIIERNNEALANERVYKYSIYENEEEDIPYIININTADIYELTALPGIGEKKALSIVEYRKEHGEFTDINELLEVKGIGKETLENIRDKITLEG